MSRPTRQVVLDLLKNQVSVNIGKLPHRGRDLTKTNVVVHQMLRITRAEQVSNVELLEKMETKKH